MSTELKLGAFPHWVAPIVMLVFMAPVIAGVAVSLLAGFGFFPALGAYSFGFDIWREVFDMAGIWTSLRLTLWVGFASTLGALMLASGLAAKLPRWLPRLSAIILAAPHAAIGVALAFLIAPSGFLVRLLGFEAPLSTATIKDPYGFALILGLMIKEIPFFVAVILQASAQRQTARLCEQAQMMGYHPLAAWFKIAFPVIYPLIRLPIFIVLAFALSVVDLSLILGPSNPPTLSIMALRLFNAPQITSWLPASALAVLIAMLVAGSVGLWMLIEILVKNSKSLFLLSGTRKGAILWLLVLSSALGLMLIFSALFSLLLLVIWSFTWRWPFPRLSPESYSLKNWADWPDWFEPFANSLWIALLSTLISLILAVIWLESSKRHRAYWFYLPLIIPQISFLFGVNIGFLQIGGRYSLFAVVLSHIFFVLPYMLIALTDPWKKFDRRYLELGASFGLSPFQRLWRIKIPLMLRPLLFASAIGFAVSMAQYLPTLFFGAGRVTTLTSEAVALSSSGDRRLIGVFGVLQIALPALAFLIALWVPQWRFRNFQAMQESS